MPLTTHKYTNGEITIVWKPGTCIHSTLCWKGLHEVFNPAAKPWINMSGAATERIIEQVRKCPSGALSYFLQNAESGAAETIREEEAFITNIEVRPNGPLVIHSDCKVIFADGHEVIRKGKTSLCRCGGSANKPFCDQSHLRNGFTG